MLAKANATAIVSGKGFTVSTSDVTVVAKAKALPSGEGFKIGTSDITIRQWDQVPVNKMLVKFGQSYRNVFWSNTFRINDLCWSRIYKTLLFYQW